MLTVDIEKQLGTFRLRSKFTAAEGITGILGASGAGKSLTLRCIAGIMTPDRGKIVLNDVTLFDSECGIDLPPQKRKVGYLFQNYALFPNMNVEKNIMCGLHYERDKTQRQKLFRDAVAMLGLTGLERRAVGRLSGGQQQRVALARILVNRPELLLLDEPFSALDAHLRARLQIEIKQLLKEYGRPVLLVTHSRDEAYHMCRAIALMEEGRLLTCKPTKELFARPASVAGAAITGCKNIVRAVKSGDHEVRVPDWGICLQTAEPVQDDLEAIGIRAHYFGPRAATNRFPVYQTNEMEEPFEWIIQFRYEQQQLGSPEVWWRLTKDKKTAQMPKELGVSPANILLLYPAK